MNIVASTGMAFPLYASTDGSPLGWDGAVWREGLFPEPTVPRIEHILCVYCKSKMPAAVSNCTQCGAPMPLR
jgi:hypothetical protein